ncbi:hypothetical protein J6D24_03480 [Candidatus Saccharibacteria bacterium]|nr:hypothetical protein [Candidatus Saccharibacteria bacterium]
MVCVAAFIILVLIGVFVAAISIFKRDFGRRYLKALKKAFHCFGKKVRLQKCDTNFSDDVKSLLLRKVILKKPKLVKPLSITIEIASVLLVVLTVWSIIEAAKAGLSLWVFGTCNISQPSNCALGADSCGLDEDNLNWFTEWGELFSNIPDRLKTWNAADYDDFAFAFATGNMDSDNIALSIIDPGCSVCLQSYKNIQKSDTFLKNHQLRIVLYPIRNTNGELRFKNSELITRFILATNQIMKNLGYSEKIINRLFTEYDKNGTIYQSVFNNELNTDEALSLLSEWLNEWGIAPEAVAKIRETLYSQEITNQLEHNIELVNSKIKPKGIPTMIYDGKKHLGLYK